MKASTTMGFAAFFLLGTTWSAWAQSSRTENTNTSRNTNHNEIRLQVVTPAAPKPDRPDPADFYVTPASLSGVDGSTIQVIPPYKNGRMRAGKGTVRVVGRVRVHCVNDNCPEPQPPGGDSGRGCWCNGSYELAVHVDVNGQEISNPQSPPQISRGNGGRQPTTAEVSLDVKGEVAIGEDGLLVVALRPLGSWGRMAERGDPQSSYEVLEMRVVYTPNKRGTNSASKKPS